MNKELNAKAKAMAEAKARAKAEARPQPIGSARLRPVIASSLVGAARSGAVRVSNGKGRSSWLAVAPHAWHGPAVAPSGCRSATPGLSGPRYFAEELFQATAAAPAAMKSDKVITFASAPEIVLIVESGADEFTFDNTWPDGTPKVSHYRQTDFHPRAGRSRRCDQRHLAEEEVRAHARAVGLMQGRQLRLPEPRVVCHEGRRPRFSKASVWGCHPDNPSDEDEHYELVADRLDEAALPGYSTKGLALWEDDFVYVTADSCKQKALAIPRDQALMILRPTWDNFIHKGVVNTRPDVSEPHSKRKRGRRSSVRPGAEDKRG